MFKQTTSYSVEVTSAWRLYTTNSDLYTKIPGRLAFLPLPLDKRYSMPFIIYSETLPFGFANAMIRVSVQGMEIFQTAYGN